MAIAVDSTVEMDTDLHYNAVNILLALYDADDETANTSQIGAVTGLSSANISGNHAQKLEHRGLIERAGSVESTAPNDTNVYTLTHRGRKEAKRLLNQTNAEIPMSDGEKLALLNFVKKHRHEIERLSERTTQPSSINEADVARKHELDKIAEQVEENNKTLDTVYDKLEDIYSRLRRLQ